METIAALGIITLAVIIGGFRWQAITGGTFAQEWPWKAIVAAVAAIIIVGLLLPDDFRIIRTDWRLAFSFSILILVGLWFMPERIQRIGGKVLAVVGIVALLAALAGRTRPSVSGTIRSVETRWREAKATGVQAQAAAQAAPTRQPDEVWQIPPGDPNSSDGWVSVNAEYEKVSVDIVERGELWVFPEYHGGTTDPPFRFRKGQRFELGPRLKVLRLKAAGQTPVSAKISHERSRY